MIKLVYQNRGVWYEPAVLEGLSWTTVRSGSPGTLSWEMYTDHVIDPGDTVQLTDGSWNLFKGYCFTTQHSHDGKIKVTAYDQLRYLKNTDTIIYENWTPEQLIRKIATDYRLAVGNLQTTGCTIRTYNGDSKTLFDMIGDALDIVMVDRRELYILYDDFGKLTLQNSRGLQVPILIDGHSAEDYDIQSSIDSQTYNQIKLVFVDSQTSTRNVYMAKDDNSIKKWGILQKYEQGSSGTNSTTTTTETGTAAGTTGKETKADTGDDEAHAQQKVNALLSTYNSISRSCTIKGITGDNRVRGGGQIYVRLSMGEVMQDGWMIVNTATHTWKGSVHTMDLSVESGVFNSVS